MRTRSDHRRRPAWLRGRCLAALGVVLGACDAGPRSVLLTVRSTYGVGGADGVDRYMVRVYRRSDGGGAPWVPVSSATYYFPYSDAAPPAQPADASLPPFDGAAQLPASEDARILLTPASDEDDSPVLVEVQAGTADARGFVAVGSPAVAQFVFPHGRERLVMTLEHLCRNVDLEAVAGAAAPWFECGLGPDGTCPVLEPICVAWDGGAHRVRCPEATSASDGGGAASCDDPDGGSGRFSAGMLQSIGDGATGCHETCGRDGRWSRCVGAPRCSALTMGVAGTPCCPVAVMLPAMCSLPLARCATDSVCVDNGGGPMCRSCGRLGEPCCGAATCQMGTYCVGGVCVAPGAMDAPCDAGASCLPGLVCAHGLCSTCGAMGVPCCDDGGCVAGTACDPDRMLCLCGGRGGPCCGNAAADAGICEAGACQGGECPR